MRHRPNNMDDRLTSHIATPPHSMISMESQDHTIHLGLRNGREAQKGQRGEVGLKRRESLGHRSPQNVTIRKIMAHAITITLTIITRKNTGLVRATHSG